VLDPTALLVIDEADRLKEAGLEQVRNIFDRWMPPGVHLPQQPFGPGNGRDDHPDDGWHLSLVEPSPHPDGANSRNQRASKGDEGSCGNGAGKPGDRRGLSLRRVVGNAGDHSTLDDYTGRMYDKVNSC
jgi:hypothetical protein